MTLKDWNIKKMNIAPILALGLWIISALCFVFGLNFKNPMGISLWGVDLGIIVASMLSIIMTGVQLMGNGKSLKELQRDDPIFFIGWVATYFLGIASNVNTLLMILGVSNIYLEGIIAVSLGAIIEIMPEKIIIRWLKAQTPEVKLPNKDNNPAQRFPGKFQTKSSQVANNQYHKPTPGPIGGKRQEYPNPLEMLARLEDER
jgi:hypothetical protein